MDNYDELSEFLETFDPETASEEEFEDFVTKGRDLLGKEMSRIATEHPDSLPFLEELAKVLTVVTNPEEFTRDDEVVVEGIGTYYLVAGPLVGDPEYGVIVTLHLENGKCIGPARVAKCGHSLDAAIAKMNSLKATYVKEKPLALKDAISKYTYLEGGYFVPYDSPYAEQEFTMED